LKNGLNLWKKNKANYSKKNSYLIQKFNSQKFEIKFSNLTQKENILRNRLFANIEKYMDTKLSKSQNEAIKEKKKN